MKKLNKYVVGTAAFTGLLCGLWGGFSGDIGLSAWAGFAGCTAYFASGRSGIGGIMMTAVTTLIGVLYGWLMLNGAVEIGGSGPAFALTIGILVMAIVLMGQIKWTAFVPGIFVGCYSFFAIENNDWKLLCVSLLAGVALGFLCDKGGSLVFAKWAPKKSAKARA